MQVLRVAVALALLITVESGAQTLPLPDRLTNAFSVRDFTQEIISQPVAAREEIVLREVFAGNAPEFLRQLCPVTVTNIFEGKTNSATFFVTPDYLAIGSDLEYFRIPLTPMTAQRIADRLDCTLPTRKMVDAIYAVAEVKLAPSPIPPGPAMTHVSCFEQHNSMVRAQLEKLPPHTSGALLAGHKKDVVITPRLATNAGKVAIYGWHQTNGVPIQPLYPGHTNSWVDYSHGIRLVQQRMILNGETTTVARVLADPRFAGLLSDEGVFTNARYPTSARESFPMATNPRGTPAPFNEHVTEFKFDPEVRIQINTPAAENFASDKRMLLILYALPNGNTIEQTVGRKLQPGDDWHFDIQHIGAQTRFLRAVLTNQTIVVAYLEAEMKSWPAWRQKHGNQRIPEIIDRIKAAFPTNQIDLVLTGHSGGGSFTFGYLNTQEKIPNQVQRIAFLDSNYAYETTNHFRKLADWLKTSPQHSLCVLAYHDSIALLNGKTFVSERGGTWGRSHAMLNDFKSEFTFASRTNASGLQTHSALSGRLQFFLRENPEKKVLHTVQVERNGLIHALLTGTALENQGYEYFGERAYASWISAE
ncbi:MAG TPA: hypothetical protein VFZ59_06710 [Verrucomicrobiae bacterium]|nr:hypothetical protein [Verrucomicrobiae bacterium]